jgi:dTMP kinase
MNRGKYIVIEGAEGVGKTTMVQLVASQLQAAGLPIKIMREPDSQNDLTARAIRALTQDPRYPMSTRTEVLLYNAARAQSLEIIRTATSNGVTCLVDRSYLTTLAIQYYGRGDVPDYETINDIIDFAVGDMQPDLMLVLDAPVATLRERTKARYSGDRFDNLDETFLERVRAGYLWEAKQRNLPVIYATENTENVFHQVWQYVANTLAIRDSKDSKPQSIAEVLARKSLPKVAPAEPPISDVTPQETPLEPPSEAAATEQLASDTVAVASLQAHVTNTEGSVYAFTAVPPTTSAAAMVQLSRSSDDMRTVILKKLLADLGAKDPGQLNQAIASYGDDSVRQLASLYIVVENVTQLTANTLERGRLATYVEQPVSIIPYDQKDALGHYRYYIPVELRGKLRSQYIRTMNQLFDQYTQLVSNLTTYIRAQSDTPKPQQNAAWQASTRAQAYTALQSVLPLAAKTSVGIYASAQAAENLIVRLGRAELAEARVIAANMLAEAGKTAPAFFETTNQADQNAVTAYRAGAFDAVKTLALDLLPPNHSTNPETVHLAHYTPHNELDSVANMLYEHSDLSLEQLRQTVASWPYERKQDVFKAYIGERRSRHHKPGRALEQILYSWDVVSDFSSYGELMRHRIVNNPERQIVTPRMGYETPEVVEAAGLSDAFDACFDMSLQLHSALQAGGVSAAETQYAALLGHKMRWQVTYNAREAFHIHELHSTPQAHPGSRKLVLAMHDKLAEVHPLLAEAMNFVHKNEA